MGSNPTPGTLSSWHFDVSARAHSFKASQPIRAQIVHRSSTILSMARGSVRRKDNGWSYRVDLGPDPATGKRRQLAKQGFRTRKEAETALGALLTSISTWLGRRPVDDDHGGVLARLARQPAAPAAGDDPVQLREGDRPRSLAGSARLPLQALTPLQIEKFYAELLAQRSTPRQAAVGEDGAQQPRRAAQGARRRRAARPRVPQRSGVGPAADGSSQGVRHVVVGRPARLLRRHPRSRASSRRCSCSPRPACGAARCSGCAGPTSTSTPGSWRSCRR